MLRDSIAIVASHWCDLVARFVEESFFLASKFPLPTQRAPCWYFVHAYLNDIVIRRSTCWTRRHGSHAISPSMVSPSTFSHFLTPFRRSCRQHSTATISASARSISIMLCNCSSGPIFAQPIVGPVLLRP